jgi:hypothetical protein
MRTSVVPRTIATVGGGHWLMIINPCRSLPAMTNDETMGKNHRR